MSPVKGKSPHNEPKRMETSRDWIFDNYIL